MTAPALLAAMLAVGLGPLAPGDSTRPIAMPAPGPAARTYRLHVPPGFDPARPTPVMVALHPFAADGAMMARTSGFDAVADRAGFLVAYPTGTGTVPFLRWNVGIEKGAGPDDLGFIDRILDDLAGSARIDPRRVYAAGFSNGAMMAYRLASERSGRFAAIAGVAGTMVDAPIRAGRPVPILHFHGSDDRYVAYDGTLWRDPGGARLLGVDATVRAWARFDGCPDPPAAIDPIPSAVPNLAITRTRFGPGRDGAEVVLYRIGGGGHTWPGSAANGPFLGKVAADLDASSLIWQFFEAHPRPDPPAPAQRDGAAARPAATQSIPSRSS